MAQPRPLTRPPIREALIDIRIASEPTIDAESLRTLKARLAAEYPHGEEKTGFAAELKIESGRIIPTTKDLGFQGLFLQTADRTRTAQFRPDGFTLNQLSPYPGADFLMAESLRLWALYREAVGPFTPSRVAMRYINTLLLPYAPEDDFERFLTAPAKLPREAPQVFSSFATRIVAHADADVVITAQKFDAGPRERDTEVTLDIDVYRITDFSGDPSDIRPVLERLRQLKNTVFFGLLTDEALELFI
jgi:uncharacterized protein (TIGR04255 family)